MNDRYVPFKFEKLILFKMTEGSLLCFNFIFLKKQTNKQTVELDYFTRVNSFTTFHN